MLITLWLRLGAFLAKTLFWLLGLGLLGGAGHRMVCLAAQRRGLRR